MLIMNQRRDTIVNLGRVETIYIDRTSNGIVATWQGKREILGTYHTYEQAESELKEIFNIVLTGYERHFMSEKG